LKEKKFAARNSTSTNRKEHEKRHAENIPKILIQNNISYFIQCKN
jgi:hypothetical protein